jgi:hypothetical protein
VTLYELEKQYSQISHENNSRKYQASLSISPEKSNASKGVEVQEAVKQNLTTKNKHHENI